MDKKQELKEFLVSNSIDVNEFESVWNEQAKEVAGMKFNSEEDKLKNQT